jgi:hypothetical protein
VKILQSSAGTSVVADDDDNNSEPEKWQFNSEVSEIRIEG